MAGHSKWANIKHKKAAQDAKRGKVFTKIIKELMVAAKTGGSDPEANPRLRQAISTAKAANMPSDTISRNVQKGAGELEGVDYEELSYEGFGPEGVAITMDVLTDNKNRTVAEIRHLMTKFGGNLGENGSVSWMFEKLGQIIIKTESINEENLFNDALDLGAEDFSKDDSDFIVTSNPSLTAEIAEGLEKKGYELISSKIEMVPKNIIKVPESKSSKLLNLMNKLEEHEDVQNIASNFHLIS
ncbi:MAG: YebC/PmpR family DNA-binding transcriptional regulator [Candidatus Neomarinimicrobiota bacterium]|nr:MAG: YebC/PmpR family DNA-binding transcriptional regulator [bacterium]|tara:strand:- start:1038 stop:1763 length:726 start_codon:yes stop_codon:yes gene_type:complete